MKNALSVVIVSLFCATTIMAQENIEYLKSFSKVYGYVKYFHPSSEGVLLDWNKFSAYGADQILKCDSQEEVITRLNEMFGAIGPGIDFSSTSHEYDLNQITPDDESGYQFTFWQHLGVAKDIPPNPWNVYNSVLVNQPMIVDSVEILADTIFSEIPPFPYIIEEQVGESIYCQIPTTLYVKDGNSYPRVPQIQTLVDLVESIDTDPALLSVRLGNVINIYNVIQHYYPYFDVVDVDWERELEIALSRSLEDVSADDHLITLQKFTAPLKDGHIWIWQGRSPYKYYPPIHWDWVQDSLVITEVLEEGIGINVGDVVTHVNGMSAEDYFKEVYSLLSYGSVGFRNFRAKSTSLSGEENTKIELIVANKPVTLIRNRSINHFGYEKINIQKNLYKKIGDDIVYLNLDRITNDTIEKILPLLVEAKGIICDFRGESYQVARLLSHFVKEDVETAPHMYIPHIIYPNQEKVEGFWEGNSGIEMREPYLGDKKVVYLVNGRTKSAAESYMQLVVEYDMATVIGQPTAGVTGNINPFKVLGDYTVWWTGMKVTQIDGSQFHCVGIKPDIVVEKTIQGVREGRDEFLEKAIEVVSRE